MAEIEDWSQEIRYELIIKISDVRDAIARHASMTKKGVSGDEFLAFCEKLIPIGVPLKKIGVVAQTISVHLGNKVGGEHSETLPNPPGTVIVAVLCSMARRGQTLKQVQQFEDGCLFEAELPSDIWAWEGVIFVNIRKFGAGSRVEGATKIEGQSFDWGKSKRSLRTLFSDIKATPA